MVVKAGEPDSVRELAPVRDLSIVVNPCVWVSVFLFGCPSMPCYKIRKFIALGEGPSRVPPSPGP